MQDFYSDLARKHFEIGGLALRLFIPVGRHNAPGVVWPGPPAPFGCVQRPLGIHNLSIPGQLGGIKDYFLDSSMSASSPKRI